MSEDTAATAPSNDEIEVRFEFKGEVLDVSKMNRMLRRTLEKHATKFRKKFKDVRGPNGERPTIVIRSESLMDPKLNVVLEYPEAMADQIKGHENAVRVA